MQTGFNGCKRGWMGADGCDGVQGAQGDTKTRQTESKNGLAGDFCDAMAGEISPNMMFLQIGRKGVQLHAKGE